MLDPSENQILSNNEDVDMQMDIEEPDVESNLPPHLQGQEQPQSDSLPQTTATTGGELVSRFETSDATIEEELGTHDLDDPRPGCLLLKGVDELDTKSIKLYIDSIVKPDYDFNDREKYARFNYKLEWVNDESINVIFESEEGSIEALALLSFVETEGVRPVDLSQIPHLQERPAQPYKTESIATGESTIKEEVKLSIRQSLWGDRKVKNAKDYSRYYLVHGEPGREQRLPKARQRRRRDHANPRGSQDLITGEEIPVGSNVENDLISGNFSSSYTPASPPPHSGEQHGIFGYDRDNDIGGIQRPDRKLEVYKGKWKSDKFDRYRSSRDDRFYNGDRRGGAYRNNRRGSRYYGNDHNSGDRRDGNRNSRDSRGPSRGYRDDEDDLFPDFGKNRDRSPARTE